MDLKNAALFKQKNYINGQWVDASTGATLEVRNPFDHSLIGTVPKMDQEDVINTIDTAHAAFELWKNKTAKERSIIIIRWANLIEANKLDLAKIITLECGKPLQESIKEIEYGNSFNTWYAEEAKRIYGDVIPTTANDRRFVVIKQPVGVCATITPWNFPNAMITRKCAPALAAGCTIIIKPSEETPYSALALAALAEEAGFPAGVINVITGEPSVIGQEFCQNTKINKLSFTGSTRVGKLLMQQCAGTLKKISLELGGNAPFIIFDDADLGAALDGLMIAKFRNAGQACIAANRIYVHDKLYNQFITQLTQRVQALKLGNGLVEGTTLSPLINQAALTKVRDLVDDAVSKGAKIVCGGKIDSVSPNAYQATIVTNIPDHARMVKEEVFGPIAAVYRFTDEKDVIAKANDTRYGLTSYFYSRDIGRVWRVAEALESGVVSINQGLFNTEATPFGGVKESGFGREGSKYGIEDFLNIKYLCMGI